MAMQKCSTMKATSIIIGLILINVLSFQATASITSISVVSGKIYQASILQVGAIQYIDRNFTFTNIDDLGNREFIQTANNDKSSTASNFLTFTITQPGLVCVAHDDRITRKPSWLSQFTLTTKDIVTTDGHPFSIYTKHFDAGTIVLGGNIAVSSGSNISMYSVVVVEEVRPTISDISVANGSTYGISTIALGEEQYIDRDYVFTQIGSLGGRQFIQAFNNDKFTVSDSFLSFTLDMPAVIYVAHDDRITTKPDWLLNFTDIGINILNSDNHNPMSVFQKVFPTGRVTLGGNVQTTPPNKFISMYTVIIGDVAESITFSKTYGKSTGNAVQQTSDKGYMINATNEEEGYPYLLRTNALGDTVFTKIFSDSFDLYTNDLQKTNDGGYILTGMYGGYTLLSKVDSSGNESWRKIFGDGTYDYGFSVQQTFDGGYVIGGLTYIGTGDSDMFLIKTDGNGNLIWRKLYGNSDTDWEAHSLQTNDSGFIIAGNTVTVHGPIYYDIYVVKTDKNGNTVWSKTYGVPTDDEIAWSIQKTNDGGYIIAGSGWYAGAVLLKIDRNGNELWHKILSHNATDFIRMAVQTNDGGYIAICDPDISMYKTDANGNIVWSKRYSVEGETYGYSIQQTTDGGYVVAGTSGHNVYILKTDANGNIDQ
jgi:hypothetical protein